LIAPYTCVNGHDVELVISIPCPEDACHTLVAYVPVEYALHVERLTEYVADGRDRALRRIVVLLVVLNVLQALLLTLVVVT
jgi:hypothetical protein